MPKRSKSRASSTRNDGNTHGGASTWPTHIRLQYHLAECAMHLQSVEQILKEEGMKGSKSLDLHMNVMPHRKQAGLRIQAIYRLCRKRYPDMLRQP